MNFPKGVYPTNTTHFTNLQPRPKASNTAPMTENRKPRRAYRNKPLNKGGSTGKSRFGRNATSDGPLFLYGLHTVRAALDNPSRKKLRLLATPNALTRLADTGKLMQNEEVTPRYLDKLLGKDAIHQGIALEVMPLNRPDLRLLENAKLVLVLDQITDPHNVGAIMRTACAFGADAVITTARYAPQETGVMAKSASGALDYLAMIEVKNLGKALEELSFMGITKIGFDSEAEAVLAPGDIPSPLAIVLGAEGKGLREKTRSLCDQMVKLDMPGPIKSLNVSNAAAIALFAATSSAK